MLGSKLIQTLVVKEWAARGDGFGVHVRVHS
jgi:hypothetical protein